MAGLNRVMLIGNLGKDPEIRILESGTKVASFPLATTETFKNKNGEKVDQTEWHNIVVWRGLADIAEKLLHKGTQVYIEGRLRTRKWEDKEGHKRYTTEVVAENFIILNNRVQTKPEVAEEVAINENLIGEYNDDENLPF